MSDEQPLLKVLPLMFWLRSNGYERFLQFEPAAINILFRSLLRDNNPM